MSGNLEATTASSSDSGHGSAPLSEPFVAVTVEGHSCQDLGNRVVVPEGAAQLHVRRSARVASSRSRSAFTAASNLPAAEFVDAPPGGKQKIGFRYQVLPPVIEDVGQASGSIIPVGNGGGLRDTANPQLVSVAPTVVPTGCKRSASGAAPGSGRCGPAPRPLASAADFSPTHFEEPRSDELPPAHQPSAMFFHRSAPPLPKVVEQDDPSPPSSPISQNSLLQQEASTIIHTPPSSRRSPRLFRTRDSTTAWAVAEASGPLVKALLHRAMCQLSWWEEFLTWSILRRDGLLPLLSKHIRVNVCSRNTVTGSSRHLFVVYNLQPQITLLRFICSCSYRPMFVATTHVTAHIC